MYIGARQATQLYESSIFRNAINEAVKSIGGIQNLKEFIIAGQSLGGANARNIGMLLINGNPGSLENTGIFGLKPEQLKVVTINSPGGGIAMTAMGFSKKKIDEYNASNIQLNLVTHNIKTGMIDLAAQIGGKQGGKSFSLTVDD
jgi:hypothetical protein